MVKEQHPYVSTTAPRFLPLAAAAATVVLVVLFLWIPVAGAAAAEQQQQRIILGNNTTSPCNVDGNNAGKEEEDGGCLGLTIIAHAQPQLEGFDMASNLGSSVAVGRRITFVTPGTRNRRRAVCGRYKFGRYISCTTDPNRGKLRKCDRFNREC